jgi:hypothetical protein
MFFNNAEWDSKDKLLRFQNDYLNKMKMKCGIFIKVIGGYGCGHLAYHVVLGGLLPNFL